MAFAPVTPSEVVSLLLARRLNRHPNHKNSSRLELKMARIKYLWSSEELIAEGKRHRDTKQVLLDLVWRSIRQTRSFDCQVFSPFMIFVEKLNLDCATG